MSRFSARRKVAEGGLFLLAFQKKGDRIDRSAGSFARDRVNPFRGFIRPTLRVTWINVQNDIGTGGLLRPAQPGFRRLDR